MKKFAKWLAAGSLVLALAACGESAPVDTQAVVDNANESWNAAFNSSDSEALSALYAEQATLSAGDGKVLAGREQIAALFQSFFDNGLHNHKIETIASYGSQGQISQLANWSADVNNEAGETVTYSGILVTVLQQKADGEWEVASHVWNMAP
ncbi:SgcJ/EcaC family oxidoreductase [Methylophaga sp. OBS3]|uniref:SgcJ/EcaC family oxidoreductase n=1 Tax=Methylophaga sp. OBS3 TaxID=2991934 RepID=UPI00224FE341|nr:SgcJ/EcaC family oxidoreductase [Methylophaga sp. OBS3]MCX4188873.1 SgcJ/EcaC family oxidoreductase [Methylophaga sp. OBS3]